MPHDAAAEAMFTVISGVLLKFWFLIQSHVHLDIFCEYKVMEVLL